MIKDCSELNPDDRTCCEQWSRVMGYHRPISSWNKGKQSEYKEREVFNNPYYNLSDCEAA